MTKKTSRLDLRSARFQRPSELHRPDDEAKMTEALDWLTKASIPVFRASAIQLKIGCLSFYPHSGTINFDNQRRESEQDLDGLKEVLERATGNAFPSVP